MGHLKRSVKHLLSLPLVLTERQTPFNLQQKYGEKLYYLYKSSVELDTYSIAFSIRGIFLRKLQIHIDENDV